MSMQHWCIDTDRGKPKDSEKKPVSPPFVHHRSNMDLTWD